MTKRISKLGLTVANNEALNHEMVWSVAQPDGTKLPLDLTDREFFAQVKRNTAPNSPVVAEIEMTVLGDPTEGRVRLHIPYDTMKTLPAFVGVYDVLIRSSGGEPDNLWSAPFTVKQGASQWSM